MTDVFNPDSQTIPEIPVVPDPVVEKRLKDKDDFIEQMKRENAEMRAEIAKAANRDKLLDDLRTELQTLKSQATQPKENTTPSLTDGDIKTLVAKAITDAEATRSATQNVQEANNLMVKHFGSAEKAGEAVQARAKELNLPISWLKDMAAKSPTAFANLMGAVGTPDSTDVNLTTGTASSGVIVHGGKPKEGTKEYFDAIRKEDRSRYFSPAVQQQLFKAVANGTYNVS